MGRYVFDFSGIVLTKVEPNRFIRYTVKPLLEGALQFNSQILERATIQDFQTLCSKNSAKSLFCALLFKGAST